MKPKINSESWIILYSRKIDFSTGNIKVYINVVAIESPDKALCEKYMFRHSKRKKGMQWSISMWWGYNRRRMLRCILKKKIDLGNLLDKTG